MKGAAAAVIAAAAAWFLVSGPLRHSDPGGTMVTPVEAEETGRSIYYQDPDGKPSYSATPRKTSDGRAYRAIPASADISFDDAVETVPAKSAGTTERKIKYYRNPMGLPDTSSVPKKDSMGMDYIPVYEGDDSDDGSVRLSPGRIQRTGVKSEPAARRVIRAMVRAPGVIQLDERRVSVISMRSEIFHPEGRQRHYGLPRGQRAALDGSLQPGRRVGGRRISRHHHVQDDRRRPCLRPWIPAAAD